MPHRISIIGQSNAIRARGFVNQLARLPGLEIGHLGRIGASPSILLPFFASDLFLAGHDFLVIDVAVVDQLFLWEQAIDPALIAAYVAYAIHRAHRVGAIPIVLVLPHQAIVPAEGDPAVPLLHQLYRQVARHNGALCLDPLPALRATRRRGAAAFAAAYDDPNHLSEDFSRAVAGRLAALIEHVAAAPPARRRREVALPQFARILLSGCGSALPGIERSNSVFSARYLRFGPGDAMTVPLGAIERVHGLLVNRATSSGIVEIGGTGRIAKLLGTEAERDLGYVAQVLPILGAMRDAEGAIHLRMADPRTAPTETSWNPIEVPGEEAEIAELLVEYGPILFEVGEPIWGERFDHYLAMGAAIDRSETVEQ